MCRSFLSVWKDEKGNEVLDGRNNLGVVSVNLPRVALESDSVESFWDLLDKRCELAHKALQVRVESLRNLTSDYAPTLYQQGAFGIRSKRGEDVFDTFFANERASVSLGYIGVHETVCHLLKIDKILHNKDACSLALNIVKYLKEKTEKWKLAENLGYSTYSTPSEGLCDRLLRLDRQKFGVVRNVTDKDYYMNSFHLDIRENATAFEKIDFEAPFHYLATGGFISYVEFDTNIQKNLRALESVWDYAMDRMGYFGTNTQSNKCYDCGNSGEFHTEGELFKCPVCGNKDQTRMSVILRICGYAFSATDRKANHGKFEEIKSRVKHC